MAWSLALHECGSGPKGSKVSRCSAVSTKCIAGLGSLHVDMAAKAACIVPHRPQDQSGACLEHISTDFSEERSVISVVDNEFMAFAT